MAVGSERLDDVVILSVYTGTEDFASDYNLLRSTFHHAIDGVRAVTWKEGSTGQVMSTRQNKKQRKGRNANNRERTVTTLTADPNTHYLVPKLSEEPARPHPPPLSGTSGSTAGQLLNMPMPQTYSMPGNFAFGYPVPFASVQHANMQQQQQQQPQQQQQQQFYTTSPQQMSQPSPKLNLPPGKNDLEILQNLKKMIKDGQHPFYRAIPSPAALASLYAGPGVTQAQPEASRRRSSTPPIVSPGGDRRLGVDQKMADVKNGVATNRPQNAPSVAHLNIEALQISKEGSAPPAAGPPRSSVPSDSLTVGVDVVQAVHDQPGAVQTGRSQTVLKDATAVRGSISPSDSRVLAPERVAIEPPNAAAPPSGTAPSSTQIPDHKAIHTAAQKVFSPGREWYPNDRVVYERPVPDKRLSDQHRPTLDDAVSYSSVPGLKTSVPRAPIAQPVVPDKKPDVPAPAPREAAQTSIRGADDVRSAESAPALPILGPTSQPPPKVEPPAPQRQYPDQPSSDMDDVRSSRASSVQPPGASATLESVPPPSSAESLPLSTDNSGVAPPYLAERVEPETLVNPLAKPSAEPTANIVSPEQRPAPPQQHFGKKNKFQKGQHFQGPGKYGRPGPPADGAPPGAGYPPRVTRPRTPSPDGRRPREYRGPPPPARPVSRERASFRAEYDPRRPDILDADIPPHPRYEPRPYSPFPPGGERRPSGYPVTPPLSGGRGPPVDAPSGRPGDYYMYPPRDEWDLQEDEYYKARERGWDRPAFERDSYGRGTWDPRQDRDYVPRDAYPPGPPPPPMPLDDRYPPGPAMPRDIDRGPPAAYGPPPYGRVRARSPSPLGRGGHPPLEDLRPPMKRAREDFPPDYYQAGRPPPARRAPADYPPPPPPPSRGGGGPGPAAEWPAAPGSGVGNFPPRNRREYRSMEYAPPYERPPPGPPGRMPYGPEGDRTGYAPRPPQ